MLNMNIKLMELEEQGKKSILVLLVQGKWVEAW